MDAYLLSRFGAGAAESLPVLDALSVRDVFETLERIGAAATAGYSREWQSAESLGQPLAVVQARGFEILADGAFEGVLTEIYDGFLRSGGRPEEGFTACYGWLYHWFNHKKGARFSPLLAECFHVHGAARFPIVPKARLGKLPAASLRKLSLKAAAARAETNIYAMKSIGLALGLIRTEKRSGSQLSFPVEEVDRIARDLKGALTLDQTAARLGVGWETMVSLMENGSLLPAMRGGNRRHSYVFRPQDIDTMLTSLARTAPKTSKPPKGLIAVAAFGRGRATTIANCVRMILDGRIKVRARLGGELRLAAVFVDPGEVLQTLVDAGDSRAAVLQRNFQPSVPDMLPFAAAAIRMRLNARGLRKAIDGGLLDGVQKGARTVPIRVAEDFARRFMMLGEIRDRLGERLSELRIRLRMAGFRADPDLEKCLCAGYLRAEIEPFLRKVERGAVVLGKPEGGWKALVRETERILTGAAAPVSSEDLLAKIRRKMTIGPSDHSDFFYKAMWDARETFVFIEGAGWWLRARPHLGHTFVLGAPAPSQAELVDKIVLELLRGSERPLSQEAILRHLAAQSIRTPIADGEVFLRRFFVRQTDKLIKLTGLGYWDRSRSYTPALYDPATWRDKTQTAVQRAGLWIMKLIADEGRPLTRAELEPMLRDRGIIPGNCTRAYIGNAVAEFPDRIVYLDRVGYWLAARPWPVEGCRPASGRKAA
ncbi:hypothetical protein [Bradyrhizobium elkanii]|uniref:hypothetical protein n=1 Tax=Bradyrhizobium elkanii TaxID=29448 RepID=UPI0035136EDF